MCAAAARRVLPVARQVHPDAYGVQLLPTDAAPFLLTVTGHRKFYHHVVVDVIDHRVDALTGTPGHPTHTYLNFYFQYPEAIREFAVDVDDVDPGIQSDE